MITDGRVLLAIEVEAGQPHPDTNVGKYWLLYERRRYQRIVLFHIYTPLFDSYNSRKELASFYETRMHELHVPIEIHIMEIKEGADYETELEAIQSQVSKSINSNFPKNV